MRATRSWSASRSDRVEVRKRVEEDVIVNAGFFDEY